MNKLKIPFIGSIVNSPDGDCQLYLSDTPLNIEDKYKYLSYIS